MYSETINISQATYILQIFHYILADVLVRDCLEGS